MSQHRRNSNSRLNLWLDFNTVIMTIIVDIPINMINISITIRIKTGINQHKLNINSPNKLSTGIIHLTLSKRFLIIQYHYFGIVEIIYFLRVIPKFMHWIEFKLYFFSEY